MSVFWGWNTPSFHVPRSDEAEKNGKVMLRIVAQGRPAVIIPSIASLHVAVPDFDSYPVPQLDYPYYPL